MSLGAYEEKILDFIEWYNRLVDRIFAQGEGLRKGMSRAAVIERHDSLTSDAAAHGN